MRPDEFTSAVQARFHGRARDAELEGDLIAGAIVDVAELVGLPIKRRECCDGFVEKLLHLTARQVQLGGRFRTRDLAAFLGKSRELHQGKKSFPFLELPTDALGDLREPCAEGGGIAQLVEVAISLEQSFDQNVFCVFAVAADANELTVDEVFVLTRQGIEVVCGSCSHTSMLAGTYWVRCVWNHGALTGVRYFRAGFRHETIRFGLHWWYGPFRCGREQQIPRRFAPRNDKGKMTARSCFARGHAIMVRFRRQSDH